MDTLLQDVRYGARMLLKKPGFSLIAVLCLALGIGANTTIFSLVNAVLLRALPVVKEPDQLVAVGRVQGGNFDTSSYPNYVDFRDRNEVLAGLAAYFKTPMSLSAGETERIQGAFVSANYFDLLGVSASRGRTFLPEEDSVPGAHPVAVLSHGLWQRRFASNPEIIDKTIILNGHSFTVIGVAPERFNGTEVGEVIEVWVPIAMQPEINDQTGPTGLLRRRDANWLSLIGRLKPGVSATEAQANMSTVAAQLEQAYPKENEGKGIALSSSITLHPSDREEVFVLLAMLMTIVGIVLLIACANVANLLLARAAARRKEIAIRLALGAGRLRVIRQLLIESTLLALIGGAAGLLIAFWTTDAMLVFFSDVSSFPLSFNFSPDLRVLGFTLLLSILTGVMFGLAPALQLSRPDIIPALKDAQSSGRSRRSRLRSIFIISQVAMSLVLLIGAGLFVRTFQKSHSIDPGFETSNLVIASIDLGLQGYEEPAARIFYRQLVERVEALPGVRQVSLAATVPLSGGSMGRGVLIGGQEPTPDTHWTSVDNNVVSQGYFETMKIPLVQGRDFGPQDTPGSTGTVIINEAMARRYWPDENPLGKRFILGGQKTRTIEVVGVVRDSKHRGLMEKTRPVMYLPLEQEHIARVTLHAKADGDLTNLIAAVRSEVRALDKNIPLYDVKTLDERLNSSLWQQRMTATLVAIFGILALLLAAIGLYGVMSYSVAERTHEIGIRMALGADNRDVLKLVVGEGMSLVAIGVVLGLGAALAATQLVTSFLYGITATDPATFVGISVLLATVALLATYIPARRATRVDPMVALRYE